MMSSSFAIVELYTAVSGEYVEYTPSRCNCAVAARMTGRPPPLPPVDFVRSHPMSNPPSPRGHPRHAHRVCQRGEARRPAPRRM